MIPSARTTSKGWTTTGLAIALFAPPLIPAFLRLAFGAPQSSFAYLFREFALFLPLGALLWIISNRERLPFTSIGVRGGSPIRSLLWGLIGAVLCAVGLVACLGIISFFGLQFGGDGKSQFSPPLWATLVTVLRAAIVEEVCYRGYAIDRVQRLGGGTLAAAVVPLVVFAGAHYRQGIGGVLIALVMGGILSMLFVRRRDLSAVIAAHFIVDFVPNILLPMISD
ncbi:MAG: type II CAAX endopeptidase family protein [Gammaproteobacteria bacterium]